MSTRGLAVVVATGVMAALASLVALACTSTAATPTPSQSGAATKPSTPTAVVSKTSSGQTEITIYLSEATGTYQTGKATLTEVDGKTRVVVDVTPAMANAQPIHIHLGTCSAVGTIADLLENVVVGKSVTEVDKPLAEIATGGTVINVHLSATEIRTYTACGDIPALQAAPR